MHVVVIGGGISGLATAFYVRRARPEAQVTVLEAAPRLGGTMVTREINGFRFEGGSNGFLNNKPYTLDLVRDSGAEPLLLPSNDAARIRYGGRRLGAKPDWARLAFIPHVSQRTSRTHRGLDEGFWSGAGQTPRGVLFLVVAWMIGLMLAPIGWLVSAENAAWGEAYLLCAVQVWWFSRRIGSFCWFTAVLYPVPLIFFFVVFARSALRSGKQVTWKGREIPAD